MPTATRTTLLPFGIATVAAFAFLKALVVDYTITLNKHRPFFEPSIRYRFREETAIPNGVQMWLGHHIEANSSTTGHTWSRTLHLYSGIMKGFQLYLFTYMVGYFVVQVTCFQWAKSAARRPKVFPVINEAPGWQQYTVPIWPDVSTALWPPPAYMDRERLERFVDRFRNLRAPIRPPVS